MDKQDNVEEFTDQIPGPDPMEDPQEPPTPYVPRPKWQIIGAWVLLGAVILGVILYYYWIAYRYV